MTEKEFYKKYKTIHVDIRSKGKTRESILKNGFKEGTNVNALPIYKGFEKETNIVRKRYNPKLGDFVWILPKQGIVDGRNGLKTKKGYKPGSDDGFFIISDDKSLYENYCANKDYTNIGSINKSNLKSHHMKLTVKNYKKATRDIDFSKLPEAAREAHKEFDSFADFYNEDKDIKEMLDNHFKIVEPYINVKRFPELPFDHPLNILDKESGQYKEALKEYRDSKKKPKATTKTRNKKTATKRTSSVKKGTSKTAKRKPNEVPLMPLEVKIIKRYLNMHGKKVTERQVSLLYKVIQKAATEKTIRKSSKYAEEVKKIGNDLARTYKEMGSSCAFEVPASMYSRLKNIVDSYGVTPAVSLIKRFINLYGNITIDKAKRLLTSIKNAKKNGKVSSSDRAYDRINQVQKHLEDYLDSDKLLVTNIQLNGLKGVAGLGK